MGSVQDWWILSEIAHWLVGTERYRSVEDVFNEITQAIPNYSGIRYQDIYPLE